MILKNKTTNKPVALLIDGIAYVTDAFKHSDHLINVATITVSDLFLEEKISEI